MNHYKIVRCRPSPDYSIWVRFEHWFEGEIDLRPLIHYEHFEAWRDRRMFMTARPDPQTGDLVWPSCGIRLDSALLLGHLGLTRKLRPAKLPREDADFCSFMARALEPVQRRRRK